MKERKTAFFSALFCVFAALVFCRPGLAMEATSAQRLSPANIKFRNIDHEALIKLGQIWRIAEDQNGFIWVAGADGLARFDGLHVKLFTNNVNDPNSLPKGFVSDIHTAKNGRVWVATNFGLYEFLPDRDRFVRQEVWHQEHQAIVIWDIAEDENGVLWLGQSGGGIGRFDPQTQDFRVVLDEGLTPEQQFRQATYTVYVDAENRVWAGDDYGVFRYDPFDSSTRRYRNDPQNPQSLVAGTIGVITGDAQRRLWIGSSDGLALYQPETDEFRQFYNDPNDPSSLSGNNIGDIVIDHEDHVWIAADGAGLNLYLEDSDKFKQFRTGTETRGSIKTDSIRRLYVSHTGDLWIGYNPYGLSVSDPFAGIFDSFTKEPLNDNSLSSNTVYALFQNSPNVLWAAGEGGVNKIDLITRDVEHHIHVPGEANSLSSNSALTVMQDSQQRLWVGTWSGGLNLYDAQTGQYTHFKHSPTDPYSISSNNVWAIRERDPQSLWVGTSAGLDIYDITNGKFTKVQGFGHRVGNLVPYGKSHLIVVDDFKTSLLNLNSMKISREELGWDEIGRITNAYVSKAGEIWFNTYDGIVRQKGLGAVLEHFESVNDFSKTLFKQTVSDANGVLWLGSSAGIASFDPQDQTNTFYTSVHGLPSDSFGMVRAAVLLNDGRVAMGGADGIVLFDPDKIEGFTQPLTPVLLGLHVLDENVEVDAAGSPLKKVISRADEITLNHEKNVFSIEYSALDFHLADLNTFKFRLIGFDPDWRDVGDQRVATYTNLDPGQYRFEVLAADDQGRWSEQPAAIDIHVLPPWWRTWWAYGLWVLAAVIFVLAIMFSVWQNSQRVNEMKVISKLKEVDRLKDEFMAKTSHELRTPLNGIIGLTEIILSGDLGAVAKPIEDKLKVVIASGKRLSNIINDILDFSKLRNHAIELNREPVELYELVQSVVQLSEPLLGKKNVILVNAVRVDLEPVVLDRQRITQVLFNLVGNAIKFTEQGEVKIDARIENKELCVSVQDSGVGIREEDQARIFQPFEQSLHDKPSSNFGTGLGLAVSKQLIELHDGYIGLSSKYHQGAKFYFVIPVIAALSAQRVGAELSSARSQPIAQHGDEPGRSKVLKPEGVTQALWSSKKSDNNERTRVLIVDDEPVNRLVLQGFLGSDEFDIVEAGDGKETLGIIAQQQPFDIVLLDVMLPGMSGYEICQEIRKNYSLSELPILFLTAKSQVEDMQKGYQVGANDFLYKPVNREELLAKMRMQLALYRALHKPEQLSYQSAT